MTLDDLRHRATITIAECAELMGMGLRQCYEAAHAGRIPAIRIGERRLVVPVPALLRLLGETEEES